MVSPSAFPRQRPAGAHAERVSLTFNLLQKSHPGRSVQWQKPLSSCLLLSIGGSQSSSGHLFLWSFLEALQNKNKTKQHEEGLAAACRVVQRWVASQFISLRLTSRNTAKPLGAHFQQLIQCEKSWSALHSEETADTIQNIIRMERDSDLESDMKCTVFKVYIKCFSSHFQTVFLFLSLPEMEERPREKFTMAVERQNKTYLNQQHTGAFHLYLGQEQLCSKDIVYPSGFLVTFCYDMVYWTSLYWGITFACMWSINLFIPNDSVCWVQTR